MVGDFEIHPLHAFCSKYRWNRHKTGKRTTEMINWSGDN